MQNNGSHPSIIILKVLFWCKRKSGALRKWYRFIRKHWLPSAKIFCSIFNCSKVAPNEPQYVSSFIPNELYMSYIVLVPSNYINIYLQIHSNLNWIEQEELRLVLTKFIGIKTGWNLDKICNASLSISKYICTVFLTLEKKKLLLNIRWNLKILKQYNT